jgi:hypothetical protein
MEHTKLDEENVLLLASENSAYGRKKDHENATNNLSFLEILKGGVLTIFNQIR